MARCVGTGTRSHEKPLLGTEKKETEQRLTPVALSPVPADHPFRALDSVLATPQIGFVAEDFLSDG